MATWSSVDAYLEALSEERGARLRSMRDAILAGSAGSGAVEVIAYDMPSLRLDGRFLVSYASFKAHDSLFPASERVETELGEELAPYLAGKGTIRFPTTAPLPLDLIRRIVEIRVREHGAG